MKGQAFPIYNYETVELFFSILINPGRYKITTRNNYQLVSQIRDT